jgi:hypothetical protein
VKLEAFKFQAQTSTSSFTIMPKKLKLQNRLQFVAKASQDLYRYERICEEHSAVLSCVRDAEACIKAHQEYTANSPPMGFMPPCNEFDRYIEVLKKECRTVLEYAAYKFDGSNSANLLFSVVIFMWYTLGSFFAGS